MNINHFMLLHIEKHRRACFTIYWFLKGRIDLNTLVRFTMVAHQKKIVANITRNNPLYEKLAKNKAA